MAHAGIVIPIQQKSPDQLAREKAERDAKRARRTQHLRIIIGAWCIFIVLFGIFGIWTIGIAVNDGDWEPVTIFFIISLIFCCIISTITGAWKGACCFACFVM